MDEKSINSLDDDCLLKIFSYFPISTLIKAEKVCTRWKILCQNSWRTVKYLYCMERDWYLAMKPDGRLNRVRNIKELKAILEYCGQYIKYYYLIVTRGQLNDATLQNLSTIVAQQCKNLTEVYIRVPNSTIPINSLLENYTNLEKLTLVEIQANMQEKISILLGQNKKLKGFSLQLLNYQRDSNKVDGKFLERLPADLKELKFTQCDSVESNVVISAIERFHSLVTLNYDSSYMRQDAIMNIIGKKVTLINLSLKNLSFESSLYNNLTNLVNLQTLNLAFHLSFNDSNLKEIANNCKQLKSLDISYCYMLTNRGIAEISNLINLEELKMINMKDVTDEAIGNLPSTLKYLSCSACSKMENVGIIKLIEKTPNLMKLNVSECFNVTGHLIERAIDVTNKRANNILRIYVCCSRSGMYACDLNKLYGQEVTKMWPYLNILYSVRANCNKRTECNFRSM